jgi:hypothetical protein
MRPDLKLFAIFLGALGVFDLVFVPFMIAQYHRTAGTPPMAAIILGAVLGVATLATAPGVGQGRRWAFTAALACRVVDLVTNALGALNHPDAVLGAGGVAGTVLSIAAIVMLVRLNPRRAVRRAASGSASR